jgi:hypothetical protein
MYMTEVGSCSIFKTIELGTYTNVAQYRKALKEGSHHIGPDADGILDQLRFGHVPQNTKINLVNLSVSEFGFVKGAHLGKILERGLEMGLELCTPEIGPGLRLAYGDQPLGNWLVIAMNGIPDPFGARIIFGCARHDHGLWLYGFNGRPNRFWGPDFNFIFVANKVVRMHSSRGT